jgi:hypothetical protein
MVDKEQEGKIPAWTKHKLQRDKNTVDLEETLPADKKMTSSLVASLLLSLQAYYHISILPQGTKWCPWMTQMVWGVM